MTIFKIRAELVKLMDKLARAENNMMLQKEIMQIMMRLLDYLEDNQPFQIRG